MKKLLVKILFVCVVFFLQSIFALSQSIEITGKFVAYELNFFCFDFCFSKAIFKLEKPDEVENQFVIVYVPHLTKQSQKKVFINSSQIRIKVKESQKLKEIEVKETIPVIDINTKENIGKGMLVWEPVKGANDELLPFGKTLRVFDLDEPTEKVIKKLKKAK